MLYILTLETMQHILPLVAPSHLSYTKKHLESKNTNHGHWKNDQVLKNIEWMPNNAQHEYQAFSGKESN